MNDAPRTLRAPVLWAERALLALACVTLVAMMLLTGADIIGRYLLAAPVPGSIELTEFALGIAIFAALPVVALHGGHIRADLLSAVLGPRGRLVVTALGDLAGAVVFALLAWRLWHEGVTVARYGTTAGSLRLPLAPLTYYAAVFSGLCALVHLLRPLARRG